MFGFFKKWLGEAPEEHLVEEAEQLVGEVSAADESAPTINPANLASPIGTEVNTPTVPGSELVGDTLALPLSAVVAALPADLKLAVRQSFDTQQFVYVPLALIYPQLGRGAVRITFGDLRRISPEGVFGEMPGRDVAIVELPLGEILARLNPANLPRRNQHQVSVPNEITSPFEGRGDGLNIYKPTMPNTAFVRKVNSTAVPEFPARGNMTSVPPQNLRMQPAPPEKGIEGVMRNSAVPPSSSPDETSTVSSIEPAELADDGRGPVLAVSLAELATSWPEGVRNEIDEMKWKDVVVNLPLAFAEDGLRKGKMVSSWRQLRAWADATSSLPVSPHDSVLLELSLQAIAPLFLARLQASHKPKKLQINQEIPDLFTNSPTPSTTFLSKMPSVAGAPSAPPPQTAPVAPVLPLAKPAEPAAPVRPMFNYAEARGKARQSNTEQFIRSGTEFLRRYATPNEIIAKAGGVEAVEGALITLPDGLLVASRLPDKVSGDTLAAFVPQVFGRLGQSIREFRMGELTELQFNVGNVPWVIFKVGTIFFAIFGRAGATLPLEELKSIAAELDRKKQA